MGKSIKSFSGNVGEWSEPYVIYKLLADGKLCQADKNFKPSTLDFVEIISAIRSDVTSERIGNGYVTFKTNAGNVVAVNDIAAKAAKMFREIELHKGSSNAFSIPWFENELKTAGFCSLKNPIPKGKHSVKRDITLKVSDPKTGGKPVLGFSIKSEIGAPPTLLNSSEQTNIVYKVKGLSKTDAETINKINSANKIMLKCENIKKKAASIEFVGYNSETFADNLDIVDAALPQMVADLVKVHYFDALLMPRQRQLKIFRPYDRLTLALRILRDQSPYNEFRRSNYCDIKIKRFLRACALGLMPSEEWNDIDDANGGYIIVLPDGELIGFYVYNRQLFEQYLLDSTMFERGSISRHQYMKLIPDGNGDFLLKLNLAIRFVR